MTFDEHHMHLMKKNVVDELFTRTADENYITARWCAMNGLQTDFFWLGVHALEKYMKAVLLVNGRPILERKKDGKLKLKFQHDITKLHAEIIKFAADLLPLHLTKPTEWPYDDWLVRPLQGFLEHLYDYGQPDNRYLVFGYSFRSEDLFMLDQAVFAYRRLICRLDARAIPESHPNAPTLTNRDMLKQSQEYFSYIGSTLPLSDLIKSKMKSPLRNVALNLNFCFAPSDFVHPSIDTIRCTRNSVILTGVLDHLNSSNLKQTQLGIELAEWAIENIKMPDEIGEAIKSAKKSAEQKMKSIDNK